MSNTITRSIEELNLRYARFCERNELDATIIAEEQLAENNKQQLWLDNHVAHLAIAEEENNHNVNVEAVAEILTDLDRAKEIGNYMLRKGESLICMANIVHVQVKRTIANILPPAPHAMANGVQTKAGFQMSLI